MSDIDDYRSDAEDCQRDEDDHRLQVNLKALGLLDDTTTEGEDDDEP